PVFLRADLRAGRSGTVPPGPRSSRIVVENLLLDRHDEQPFSDHCHSAGWGRCPVLSRRWRARCIGWGPEGARVGLRTAGAFGLGAGAMYLLDPQRGRARRARLRDKAVRTVHEVEEAARGRTADTAHRFAGALAEARGALRNQNVDDDIVRERVRSRIG